MQGALPEHMVVAVEVDAVHHLVTYVRRQTVGHELADLLAEGVFLRAEIEIHLRAPCLLNWRAR
jgi:hypothetical protein